MKLSDIATATGGSCNDGCVRVAAAARRNPILDDLEKRVQKKLVLPGYEFQINGANGGYRLERVETESPKGSSGVSPRLPAKALVEWVNAYLAGFSFGKTGRMI